MDTKALRQRILDLAIHGRLVPQDPADEPASELLCRIRAEKEKLVKEGKIKKSGKKAADIAESENIPFELPAGWVWTTLREICSFGGGKTPSMDIKQYWENGDFPWVTSKDMKSSRISNSSIKITKEALPLMSIYGEGTLLVVTRSGILKHTLPLAILCTKATVNQDLKTLTPFINGVSEYLYVSIKAFEKKILISYHKDGTTVDSIDFDKFQNMPIPLPPLAEQRRIVKKVEDCFRLIEEVERGEADLRAAEKQMRSKILDMAIHGRLVPQDPADEPASELVKRINPKADILFEDERFGRVPEGWCLVKLKEISNYGKCENTQVSDIDKDSWVLELEDIEKDSAKIIQRLNKSERKINGVRHKFSKGDILYSKLRTYLNKVLVAPEEGFCTTEIIPFNSIVNNEYVCQVLRSPYFLDYTAQCGFGVKMPRLSTTDAHKALIPLPPLAEQRRIVKRIEELFGALTQLTANK